MSGGALENGSKQTLAQNETGDRQQSGRLPSADSEKTKTLPTAMPHSEEFKQHLSTREAHWIDPTDSATQFFYKQVNNPVEGIKDGGYSLVPDSEGSFLLETTKSNLDWDKNSTSDWAGRTGTTPEFRAKYQARKILL